MVAGYCSLNTRSTIAGVVSLVVLTACATPEPYRPAPSSQPPAAERPGEGPRPLPPPPVQTQPGTPPPEAPESQPLPPPPPPPPREPTLGAASRSLVTQAQTQVAAKNFPLAAANIERALRIEPENPLLWIELAKIRQAEGNSVQAETLARRALRSTAAPKAQAAAWAVIADSYRARGRNNEARQAQSKAETLRGG